MTIKLVKILEAAQTHYEKSLYWFEKYEKADKEKDKVMYWNWSEMEEDQSRGLLEAYEIITGKKLHIFEIKQELKPPNVLN